MHDIYAGSNEPIYWVASHSNHDGLGFCPFHRVLGPRAEAEHAVRLRLTTVVQGG